MTSGESNGANLAMGMAVSANEFSCTCFSLVDHAFGSRGFRLTEVWIAGEVKGHPDHVFAALRLPPPHETEGRGSCPGHHRCLWSPRHSSAPTSTRLVHSFSSLLARGVRAPASLSSPAPLRLLRTNMPLAPTSLDNRSRLINHAGIGLACRLHSMGELEGPGNRELVVQAVGAVFATLLGLAVGGPLGALAGAGLTPYGIRWIQLATAEWNRKSQVIAENALDASGTEDPEEFFHILSEDPGLTALAHRILFAAYLSGNERKLRALGMLLGGAIARRGDRLDEATMLASVLGDIEEPQVVTLDILTGEPPDADEQREDAKQHGRVDSEPSWLGRQVESELPMNPELTLACLSDLVRYGLAERLGTYGGGSRYRITSFGRSLTAVLARVAE
jgi:hypothetical protein